MPRFTTIGMQEKINLVKTLSKPLSGYLGGVDGAGYWIEKLQSDWQEAFSVPYAIACNSATSGLLAACMAAGIGPGDEVWVSSYTMSATAGAPKVLGANVLFMDIEDATYGMACEYRQPYVTPKAIIVTNLFGHPAQLSNIRGFCDKFGIIMIEDNAQAPFAKEGNRYAGTIGHMGVFSLNVHKHIQCGEGGVVVTQNEDLAERVFDAINHGELRNGEPGLNLRMAEPIAAIACAQLEKADKAIESRIDLAKEISYMVRDIPAISAPVEREGCRHVYYMWAGRVRTNSDKLNSQKRYDFIKAVQDRGVPLQEGYITPLHILFKADHPLPVVNKVELTELITFEICAYDPNIHHLKSMSRIIHEEAGVLE